MSPLPIQTGPDALALARRFGLLGKLPLQIDEIVIPTIDLGGISTDSDPTIGLDVYPAAHFVRTGAIAAGEFAYCQLTVPQYVFGPPDYLLVDYVKVSPNTDTTAQGKVWIGAINAPALTTGFTVEGRYRRNDVPAQYRSPPNGTPPAVVNVEPTATATPTVDEVIAILELHSGTNLPDSIDRLGVVIAANTGVQPVLSIWAEQPENGFDLVIFSRMAFQPRGFIG